MSNVDRIRQVISATMNIPIERVGRGASMETLPEWDSVAHVALMMAIEEEFDFSLEVEDFERLTTFESIKTYLDNIIA